MNYRTILVYAAIAAVIAVAVAYILSSQLNSAYNISVTLRANVPTIPYPFQTGYFRADINNTGSGTATSVPLLIYLNGNPIGSYKVTLPPGKGGAVAWNYTFPYNGTYRFQVIVDPGHVFRISNRSMAQGGISVNVSVPQNPRVYASIPNGNITSTQGFTILQNGSTAISAVVLGYNISILNDMLGPARAITLRTLQDLSGTVNLVKGAVAYYPGNQIAYTAWLQGTLSPSLVGAIVNSFSISESNTNANGTPAKFSRISNTTSMCFYYYGGWTKIVSYYNSTQNATCSDIVKRSYSGNASALLVGADNSTAKLQNLSSKFFYTNSTYLGSALSYSNGTYGASSVFGNQYGTFISYIQRNRNPVNLSVNSTCNGIVYPTGNLLICSSAVSPIKGSGETTDLLNETEVTSNYTARIYSFVNRTNIILANDAGINLILSLNLSNRSAGWISPFVNTCSIANVSISCKVVSFSHANYTAVFGITNGMGSPITLNSISCAVSGERQNQPVSLAIAPNRTVNVTTLCRNMPAPIVSISTTYNLWLNYTVSGAQKNATGQVTIINLAS